MKLILITILIGQLKITAYRSVPSQTDSSPYHTSTHTRVFSGGCAVSRDLLCGACRKLHKRCQHPEYEKKLHYGNNLYINGHGFVQINDCMGEYTKQRVNGKIVKIPIKQQLDIWVSGLAGEKALFKQYKNGKTEVWKVRDEVK